MDSLKSIPWSRVDDLLRQHERTQSWLARRLNLATNVVTNWKRRGAVPMARANDLAKAFGVPMEQLLLGLLAAQDLSKTARRIVARLSELDQRGLLSHQVETAVMALLDLAEEVGAAVPPRTR